MGQFEHTSANYDTKTRFKAFPNTSSQSQGGKGIICYVWAPCKFIRAPNWGKGAPYWASKAPFHHVTMSLGHESFHHAKIAPYRVTRASLLGHKSPYLLQQESQYYQATKPPYWSLKAPWWVTKAPIRLNWCRLGHYGPCPVIIALIRTTNTP